MKYIFSQPWLRVIAFLLCCCVFRCKVHGDLSIVSSTTLSPNPSQEKLSQYIKNVLLRKRLKPLPDITPTYDIVPSIPKIKSINTQEKHSSVIMIRLLLFLFYATLGSALPYIPLYYRYLGISGVLENILLSH